MDGLVLRDLLSNLLLPASAAGIVFDGAKSEDTDRGTGDHDKDHRDEQREERIRTERDERRNSPCMFLRWE